MSSATGPIADLSYRTYDGQLDPPTHRWKVIAKANIMRVFKNKWYWVLAFLGGWYYIGMMIALLVTTMLSTGGAAAGADMSQILAMDWTGLFHHGFSFSQFWLMFIGLIAGAGVIANDNRCNALLVYLSKPCTKKDYIIGKWVGVFVPIAAAMLIPTLGFYIYGALNFNEQGFLSDDPFLLFRMILVITVSAAFQTSMLLTVSSMFNQGRIAGATYAGVFFIPSFITVFMGIILVEAGSAPAGLTSLAQNLFYMSIDGLSIGFSKLILELDSPAMFMGLQNEVGVDRPSPLLVIGAMGVLSALGLMLVRKRVRAVEVA